jgi:hypothetical protein
MGCSTTATISRRNDVPIEAEIAGGSRQSIFIVDDTGRRYEVPRETITDVDYPGNVHAGIGGGILGYGIVNIALGVSECDSLGAAYCAGVFTPAIVGALLLAWGLVVYDDAQSSFLDTSHPSKEGKWGHAPVARRPRRPPPDTRPVAPLPVELEEDTGPTATPDPSQPGPTATEPRPAEPLPPSPPAPPGAAPPGAAPSTGAPSASAPAPKPPAPAPTPPPPSAPAAPKDAPTKAFPVD